MGDEHRLSALGRDLLRGGRRALHLVRASLREPDALAQAFELGAELLGTLLPVLSHCPSTSETHVSLWNAGAAPPATGAISPKQ